MDEIKGEAGKTVCFGEKGGGGRDAGRRLPGGRLRHYGSRTFEKQINRVAAAAKALAGAAGRS